MKKLAGLLLFLVILGILGWNFNRILTFAQAQTTRNHAESAIKDKNWTKAITIYEGALDQYGDNPDLILRLAWLYQKNAQPEKAEALYKVLLEKQNDNLQGMIGLANLLKSDSARLNEVVELYRRALKKYPENPLLLNNLGNLYREAAENPAETREGVQKWLLDQARYYYQLSLALEPKQFKTHFNLGLAYQSMGNLQPAAASYCQAVLLKPDSFEARYNLGATLSELNYLEQAYRQLDQAVQILSDKDDVENVQIMARKIQTIKNANYYDTSKQGLAARPEPDFLDRACLLSTSAEAKE